MRDSTSGMTLLQRVQYERPITAGWLFLAGLLFAAVETSVLTHGISHDVALAEWGGDPQGFLLWNGDWWRVFISGFHHAGWFHLLGNALVFWMLGGLLEQRLGSLRYAAFLLASLAVSGVIQTLWSPYVGLSGVCYAQFGAVVVLREREPNCVPADFIRWGWIWLLLCLPLTWSGILAVGNAAHFAGVAYGWLAGQAAFGRYRGHWVTALFLSGHAWLLPAFYWAEHPVWNGIYHWHLADKATEIHEKMDHWRRAVAVDPHLSAVWRNLATMAAREDDLLQAWQLILQGLQHNPDDVEAARFARRLWSLLTTEQQAAAEQQLQQTFGDAAPKWHAELIAQAASELPANPESMPPDAPQHPLRELFPLEPLGTPPPGSHKLPPPDPEAPGSAEEGRTT